MSKPRVMTRDELVKWFDDMGFLSPYRGEVVTDALMGLCFDGADLCYDTVASDVVHLIIEKPKPKPDAPSDEYRRDAEAVALWAAYHLAQEPVNPNMTNDEVRTHARRILKAKEASDD